MKDSYDDTIYWIWFTKITGIGPVTQRQLIQTYGNPKEIFEYVKHDEINVKGISKECFTTINIVEAFEIAKRIFDDCDKTNTSILTCDSEYYPLMAREIKDSPVVIYYRGRLKKDWWGDAVVGSRRCYREGKERAIKLAKELGDSGITVISGMAKGIDSYAHTECIINGTYTIAVLGNGTDICYPNEHEKLMESIVENGAIISEYEPGVRPSKYSFPKRNRIIAACSRRIFIPDVGERSGAKITAALGQKYGREVVWGDECILHLR